MMQDVATAKSEIAAFANSLGMKLPQKPESNENFDQLMQDQRTQQSQQQSDKKQPVEQTLSNNSVVPNTIHGSGTDKTQKTPEDTRAPEDTRTQVRHQIEVKDAKSDIKELSNIDAKTQQPAQRTTIKQDSSADKSDELTLDVKQEVRVAKFINEDVLILNGELKSFKAELKQALPDHQPESEIQQGVGAAITDDAVAEEWVALIKNLQRLADVANTKDTKPSVEQSVTLDAKQLLPEDIEQTLSKQLVQEQMFSTLEKPIKSSDLNVDEAQVVVSKFIDLKVLDSTATTDTSLKAKQPDFAQTSVSLLVQQSLEKLTTDTDSIVVPSEKTQQQAAALLLSDPQFLQSLHQELEKGIQKPEITIEDAEQTLKASSELLRALISNSETTESELAGNAAVQELKVSNAANLTNLDIEKQQAELNKVALVVPEIVVDEVQIEAQMSQISQPLIAPVLETNISDTAKKASDISTLLALPDKKLTKVLEHIAARVMPGNQATETINPDQEMTRLAQQVVIPKATDFSVATDNQAKEFISALKSGLEEFKQQVAQGREPGIDLKSLISDAVAKSNQAVESKAAPNIQQITQSVSQVLDLAQSISRAIEHHQEQTYSAVQRDVAQIQGEQSKSLQFNQFEAKFEKAVNITKPEGHQQLAEKVRWMVNTKNLVADIRLDPAELGSVHVKVAMSGESATVNFVVQSQHARDAMDNAAPKLREMLAEKGIELGQSSVEQESNNQTNQGEGELANKGGGEHGLEQEPEVTGQVLAEQNIVNGALGGIDYFV